MNQIRLIEQRRRGQNHGPIRRIIAPSELGQRLKPFVFLDFIDTDLDRGLGFGFHPHSGIATLTYNLTADVQYEDTSGQKGLVAAGGLEWMLAGGGVWHQGSIQAQGRVTGFQLWLALPPHVEDGPSQGLYIPPADVLTAENIKVLLGNYAGTSSAIATPTPINYFDVVLNCGESWSYQPPIGHQIAWLFVYRGEIAVGGDRLGNELAIFDQTDGMLEIKAMTDARILMGTAVKHDYPLVLGPSSVHTNAKSLAQGLVRIKEIGKSNPQQTQYIA